MTKNVLFRLLTVIGFGSALLPAAAGAFCIQNFNAYGPLYAGDTRERTELFTEALTRPGQGCGIVHFQEVWNKSHIDQVADAMESQYTIMDPDRRQRIGLMSLVQGRVLQQETYVYKVNNLGGVLDSVREMAGVSKAFHAARVELEEGSSQPLWMVNTHLHPSSARVRTLQLLEIVRWRLQNPDFPMVLSGDFNMTVDSLERRFVMTALGALDSVETASGGEYPKGFCTYCEANPRSWMSGNYVFDYVLIANGAGDRGFEPVGAMVNLKGTPGFSLSDHYGLRVELEERTTLPVDERNLEERRQDLMQTFTEIVEDWKKDGSKYQAQIRELRSYHVSLQSKSGPFWSYFRRLR